MIGFTFGYKNCSEQEEREITEFALGCLSYLCFARIPLLFRPLQFALFFNFLCDRCVSYNSCHGRDHSAFS